MKNLFSWTLVVLFCMSATACNQDALAEAPNSNPNIGTSSTEVNQEPASPKAPNGPTTTVAFANEVLELGELNQGDKAQGVFTFTNTGNEPLIITNAKGSCGCTVPSWPKSPIAPGESSEIAIEFNSKGKSGKQTKTVTIQANTGPDPIRLTVKANILVAEESAAN